jgi:ProP effector
MSIEPISPISKRRARAIAWNKACIETLLLLCQRFPLACPQLNARIRRPLKVGIHNDIAAALREIGITEIKRALRFYCADPRYLRACTDGADRLDLAGNIAGTVTAPQAENAKAMVTGIEAKRRRREQTRKPGSSPASPSPSPASTSPSPKRLTLADLRAVAAARKLHRIAAR